MIRWRRLVLLFALTSFLPGCCSHMMPRWLRGPSRPPPPAPAPGEPMVLTEVWNVPHGVVGFDVDKRTGDVYSIYDRSFTPEGTSQRVLWLDRHGGRKGSYQLDRVPELDVGALRLAQLNGEAGPEFLLVGEVTVTAFDSNGSVLWFHQRPRKQAQGTQRWERLHWISEVCVQDLDGDGRDEVLIAYKYAEDDGIAVLNCDGSVRWRYPGRSPRHLAAGPTGPQGSLEIAFGHHGIHLLNATGDIHREMHLSHPAQRRKDRPWVDITRVAYPQQGQAVIVLSDWSGSLLGAMHSSGELVWQQAFPDMRTGVMDMAAADDRPWVAMGTWRCRRVVVHDVRTGERLASVRIEGWPQLAWIPATGEGPPLLIVRSPWGLRAYELRPVEVETAAGT